MRSDSWLPIGRVDRSRTTLALAAGDVAVISLFLTWGATRHGADPLADPSYVAGVVAPFLVGWALAAPLVGAYAAAARSTPAAAAAVAAVAWLGADVVGLGLRSTALFHGGVAATFALVTVAVGAASLGAWRAVAALTSR